MLRRSFFLKFTTLLGVGFAALKLPNELGFLGPDTHSNTIVYELHGALVKDIDKVYKIDNIKALKKSFKQSGKLISVCKTQNENLNKVVLTFNNSTSRQEFINEYNSNLSHYKKLS